VYSILLVLFLYLLNRKIKHGPDRYLQEDEEENSNTKRNNTLMEQI